MNRNERVITEVDVETVAVPVDDSVESRVLLAVPVVPVAVAVAVAVATGGECRDEDHQGAQVVLDRVSEEHGTKEQAGEGECVSDPVAAALVLRLRDQLDKTLDEGGDRSNRQDDSADEDRVE